MPDNANERLENEALESLVASDLSAKMKQWRGAPPTPPAGGKKRFWMGFMLLALGGAAWLLWPHASAKQPMPAPPPSAPSVPPPSARPMEESPVAQKTPPLSQHYLALAQTSYRAPDFVSEVRGNHATTPDALLASRTALSHKQYAEALNALHDIPDAYQTDAAYLRGHALFGQKKYAQAADVFGQLTGSARYGEAAQWFEALSLLPDYEQHKIRIKKILDEISAESGHAFQHEALALRKKI